MKRIFLISWAVFIFTGCQQKDAASSNNTDLVQQNLKGKVRQIEETSYKIDKTGQPGQTDSLVSFYDFDPKGYQVNYTVKYSDGRIKQERSISHYDNGAAKEVVNKTDGKQTLRMTIDIDNNGNYVMAKSYDSADKISGYYKNLTQNEYGEVLTGNQYHSDNSLTSSFVTTYDKANYTGNTNKDSTGKVIYSVMDRLNDKGDPIESTTITLKNDGTNSTETVMYKYDKYDDIGNWSQRTTYDDKGTAIKTVKRKLTYYK